LGAPGADGVTGATGSRGPAGATGATGPAGATGLAADNETRFAQHESSLGDLSLGLGFVGKVVETLQTNLDALDVETRFTQHENSLGDLSMGLGFVGATVETRFNYQLNALGDLGLGLGLVGVTIETLQTDLGALDENLGGQLQTLIRLFQHSTLAWAKISVRF